MANWVGKVLNAYTHTYTVNRKEKEKKERKIKDTTQIHIETPKTKKKKKMGGKTCEKDVKKEKKKGALDRGIEPRPPAGLLSLL